MDTDAIVLEENDISRDSDGLGSEDGADDAVAVEVNIGLMDEFPVQGKEHHGCRLYEQSVKQL